MKQFRRKSMNNTRLALCVLLVGIGQTIASASIIGTTGDVLVTAPPASVLKGQDVNAVDASAFDEQSSVTLGSALVVDIISPGFYTSSVGMPFGSIAGGTTVSSYYIHMDPGVGAQAVYSGSITFSTPILGIIALDAQFRPSDAIVGNTGTTYPETNKQGLRQLEFGPITDTITWSGNTIFFHDSVSSATDDIRIITAATGVTGIPEPSTVLLLLGGLGGLALYRRTRRVV
jgi:hypothetical protein